MVRATSQTSPSEGLLFAGLGGWGEYPCIGALLTCLWVGDLILRVTPSLPRQHLPTTPVAQTGRHVQHGHDGRGQRHGSHVPWACCPATWVPRTASCPL